MKLVVFNKNTRIASRQPGQATILRREPCTPRKMVDEESSNQSFFWPLLNGKKKELKNERFSAPKIFSWGDLKEHLNNIFFKRGVIVMVVLIAFLNPIVFFSVIMQIS